MQMPVRCDVPLCRHLVQVLTEGRWQAMSLLLELCSFLGLFHTCLIAGRIWSPIPYGQGGQFARPANR